MERFSRGQSVPPSALRAMLRLPRLPFSGRIVENSRFPALFGRRDAESSDALQYLASGFARACRWRDIACRGLGKHILNLPTLHGVFTGVLLLQLC